MGLDALFGAGRVKTPRNSIDVSEAAGVRYLHFGSEWVQGDTRILANILLHGINGEISVAGATYSGAMPAFQQLSDAELAAVASYIRSAWSNKAEALPATLFEQERQAGSARTTPFEGGAALKALAGKPA